MYNHKVKGVRKSGFLQSAFCVPENKWFRCGRFGSGPAKNRGTQNQETVAGGRKIW